MVPRLSLRAAGAALLLLAASPLPGAIGFSGSGNPGAGLPGNGGWKGALLAQHLLVPMDDTQRNHLKAYGLTYRVIAEGLGDAEWLLNHRGGAFLLPDRAEVVREAERRGVTTERTDAGDLARIRREISEGNMESVPLDKAPTVAIYTPPDSPPWGDAVTMALTYAEIPYETVWDRDVLTGELSRFEWLHLHHEDFTGQYSKNYIAYSGAPWLRDEVARNRELAAEFGFDVVPELKKAVAGRIREYVEAGGFLFAMCSATETLDLALAGAGVDFASEWVDGSPPQPDANARMAWGRALAFRNAEVQLSATVNAFSDIDGHQVNTPWRVPLGRYELFEFSAEFDPVASMLTQNHRTVIPDFYGLTTSFRADRIKPGVTILARDGDFAKYLHGSLGEGMWTFFGGHDPEDPEHQIGDDATDLDQYRNSPGYRLILNNVLFPAARKKPLKT